MDDAPTTQRRGSRRGETRRAPHLCERDERESPGGSRPRVDVRHRVVLHEAGTPIFGPGTYDLLVLVDESGSLRQAAGALGMSYSKAWRIMRRAEDRLGLRLLERRVGGSAGGGSALSADGRLMVLRYRALVAEADADLATLYRKHFAHASFARSVSTEGGSPSGRD